MEKENQTIEDLKDKKVDLNKQFEVRRAAVQAKEWFNQLLTSMPVWTKEFWAFYE